MARHILAALLLAMAAGQISDLPGFVDAVEGYQLGGRAPAWGFAVSILIAEAVAGVGLWRTSRSARRLGSAVGVVVAVAWTVVGVQAFARGLALDNCGCFGVHLAQPLRWWVLVEDAEFVALAWWVRRTHESGRRAGSAGFPARLSAINPWRKPCSTITQPGPRADSTAAGEATTITFENLDDGVQHNLHVQAGDVDVQTDIAPGPDTQELTFTVEEPGGYTFICDVHPDQMTGELDVS